MSDTVIIIPTYNERENIERLIAEIFRYANDVDILVVDDNSPDGTAAIVERLAGKDKRVSVMCRISGRGRGLAGIDAFREIARRKGVDHVMEMDADFSHDPKYIPSFLKEIKHNDIVIGSRFVKGGRDAERSALRNFLSKVSNSFIRNYLGLDIRDCSSGYRCFKRRALASLDLDSLISKGPAIIEETLYVSSLSNYRIKEIPIVFHNRFKGKTKLGPKRLLKVFIDVLRFKDVHSRKDEGMKETRRFGFSFGLALNILGAIMFYRGRGHFIWFTGAGALCLIGAILNPRALAPLKRILDLVILSIGRIVNVISLTLVFFLVFTPIAILLRLFKKDMLCQRIDRSVRSYWVKRKKAVFSIESYDRMG